MHDHIGPVVERFQHERGGDGIVHDQRHAGVMGHPGDRFQVDDIAGRIADGLAEHRAGAVIDQRSDRLRPVIDREACLDAQGWKHVGEVGEGGAVELRRNHQFEPAVATVRME